ncbi:class II D-tagatose-bisphosphate aldolase non-catalytic subunit [Candidatus Caldatribacterium saccharofermentans]|uniref:class II D-tagatose-bisphosphate aldolase non-catalytic subunit n=1 Tax=Candidatus Caldatribacterium saccharofermentans TaxID=1454753 RepID=UPI003CFE3B12
MFPRETVDTSPIREKAQKAGVPVCDFLMRKMQELAGLEGKPQTLLAVCPNSRTVIRAALRAAKRARAPVKFAATLNQVDIDRGYTGLTQGEFVELVKQEAEAIHFEGLIIIALDHGGPWVKDRHTIEGWDLKTCMDWVKRSFEAAIDAGYDLLHVDPTVDRTLPPGTTLPVETVIERTVELIEHAENHRKKRGLPPISYEVGTEEVHGGLADLGVFERFLAGLKDALKARGLEGVWPIFVVGKVGTDLHTTLFDPQVARVLSEKARSYGSFIKGHYTDYVENPEDYPKSGMGAANVGPEFTEEEYNALAELAHIEEELFARKLVVEKSEILEVLTQEVRKSGRWKKWLLPEEMGKDLLELPRERKMWLVKTGCRYIWAQPEVVAKRALLYENLKRNGYFPEDIVLTAIERALDKYFRAFNLVDLDLRLQKVL